MTGTWIQELIKRPLRSATYWPVPHSLANLLSFRIQDHQPRGVCTHSGLGPPPYRSLNKKCPSGLPAYSLISGRHSLSFSDDFSQCQVDRKLTRTAYMYEFIVCSSWLWMLCDVISCLKFLLPRLFHTNGLSLGYLN